MIPLACFSRKSEFLFWILVFQEQFICFYLPFYLKNLMRDNILNFIQTPKWGTWINVQFFYSENIVHESYLAKNAWIMFYYLPKLLQKYISQTSEYTFLLFACLSTWLKFYWLLSITKLLNNILNSYYFSKTLFPNIKKNRPLKNMQTRLMNTHLINKYIYFINSSIINWTVEGLYSKTYGAIEYNATSTYFVSMFITWTF